MIYWLIYEKFYSKQNNQPMIYNFETYYSDKIDYIKVVKIVASYTASFCELFEAGIIAPKKKYKGIRNKSGQLPVDNKDEFLSETIDWIIENSEFNDLFKLFLYNNPISPTEPRIFDHHDDTCCWVLNLTNDQFIELKNVLLSNNLPEDLFYEPSKLICLKAKGILGFLGFNKCFTPKEYKVYADGLVEASEKS